MAGKSRSSSRYQQDKSVHNFLSKYIVYNVERVTGNLLSRYLRRTNKDRAINKMDKKSWFIIAFRSCVSYTGSRHMAHFSES